jgi:hypothetical protein
VPHYQKLGLGFVPFLVGEVGSLAGYVGSVGAKIFGGIGHALRFDGSIGGIKS